MKTTLLLTLITPLLATAGCRPNTPTELLQDKRKGELTREIAADVIKAHLAAKKFVSARFDLGWAPGGLKAAIADGLVTANGTMLTDQGVQKFKSPYTQMNAPEVLGSKVCIYDPAPQLIEVTGITAAPFGDGKLVEYLYELTMPPNPSTLHKYCGRVTNRGKVILQRYDDGWRAMPDDE